MNRYISIAGGLLIAISLFFPFITAEGATLKGFAMGVLAYFCSGLGFGIVLVGIADKRWLNILNFLLGLIIVAVSVKYSGDANDSGGSSQVGVWMLFIGGFITIAGAIKGMVTKQRYRVQQR